MIHKSDDTGKVEWQSAWAEVTCTQHIWDFKLVCLHQKDI